MAGIVHVLAPGPVAGAERVVQMLAAAQAERGRPVSVAPVLEPEVDPAPFVEPLEAAGVRVDLLRVPHRAYLSEWRALGAAYERLRPDVVHTHGYRADVIAAATARRRGVPTVSTVHGFTGGSPKNRLYEALQLRAYRRCPAVVAVSRAMLPRLRAAGVPDGRLHVVPNAWRSPASPLPRAEARRILGLEGRSGRLVGWVGRLSREKGADLALRALAALGDARATLVVVGDGPEEEDLRRLAGGLGVADRVAWAGRIPDGARLFRAFDLFLLSSRTEGVPIVLFEAMAAGTPIVATAVGGVPEVVRDGREARLAPPEDVEGIAAALREALADPESAARRAAAARARLETEFGPDAWVRGYDRVYGSVREDASAAEDARRRRGSTG